MNVALIYGGRSTEHNVSIASAKTVHQALKQAGFKVLLIGITLQGRWYMQPDEVIDYFATEKPVQVVPALGLFVDDTKLPIDAVFTTTHGYGGEDGSIQGLLTLCKLPVCGCDTVSSAVGMYKQLASTIFEQAKIPTVPTMLLTRETLSSDRIDLLFAQAKQTLCPDLFVKPENSGSSVGVSALYNADLPAFQAAVSLARRYSERVLVQPLINPLLEVETAVLQTEHGGLIVAGPALVIDPAHARVGFLSYAHKYGEVDTAHIRIPSGLDASMEEQIRAYARKAFLAIKGGGYARIDFFVSGDRVYLNEINTSPGMTYTSHYPALMASEGYTLADICTHLVTDALHRSGEEQQRIYTPPER